MADRQTLVVFSRPPKTPGLPSVQFALELVKRRESNASDREVSAAIVQNRQEEAFESVCLPAFVCQLYRRQSIDDRESLVVREASLQTRTG